MTGPTPKPATTVAPPPLVGGSNGAALLHQDGLIHDRLPPRTAQLTDDLQQLFQQSPLTGCTSLMSFALRASGWNPLAGRDPVTDGLPDDQDHYNKFESYVSNLMSVPIFSVAEAQQPDVHLQGPATDPEGDAQNRADWDGFLTTITQHIPGLQPDDYAKLAADVKHLAHQVFSGSGGAGHQAMFVQHAFAAPGDGFIYINLYWCKVDMQWVQASGGGGGKSAPAYVPEAKDDAFTVHRIHIPFPTLRWPHYADTVARYQLSTFQQFFDQFTLVDSTGTQITNTPTQNIPSPAQGDFNQLCRILRVLTGPM